MNPPRIFIWAPHCIKQVKKQLYRQRTLKGPQIRPARWPKLRRGNLQVLTNSLLGRSKRRTSSYLDNHHRVNEELKIIGHRRHTSTSWGTPKSSTSLRSIPTRCWRSERTEVAPSLKTLLLLTTSLTNSKPPLPKEDSTSLSVEGDLSAEEESCLTRAISFILAISYLRGGWGWSAR